MSNNRGGAYNLAIFLGTTDLRTLSPQQIQANILNHTLQDGPIELQPASYGATCTRMDSLAIHKIQTLFFDLCSGYSNQSHVALDHICQVHTNCNGNPVSSSVQVYYNN